MTPRTCILSLMILTLATTVRGAEFTAEREGAPAITHVKLLRNDHEGEWWAWVTIDHEDWPIESRRFLLPEWTVQPPMKEHILNERFHDFRALRRRRLNHPYPHFVNWWVVLGPKGEKIHKRFIEGPHPGGWPYVLLEKGIKVPVGITKLTFVAHDKIHGAGTRSVTVDLLQKKGPNYEVEILPLPPYSGRYGAARRHFRELGASLKDSTW